MKKVLFYLSVVAIPALAQTPSLQWEKNINGVASGYEQTQKAWKDPAGNFYLTGTTSNDAFLIKTDVNGNVLLKLIYDGPQNGTDYGYDVKADAAGNIYLAGVTQYNALYVPYVVKYNSSGVKLWEYLQPNNMVDGKLTAVILDNYTNPANVYFTGSKNDTASTTKINSATGSFVWRYMYNPGRINDIDIDNNGRPLICGYISNFGANNPDLFAAQLDVNTGYPQRYFTLDGAVTDSLDHGMFAIQHFDMGTKIKAGPAGTFVVLGSAYENLGYATMLVLKWGSAGSSPIWVYYSTIPPPYTEGEGVQLQADASFSNFYYLAKANYAGGGYTNYTIAGKINNSGTAVWEKEYIQGCNNLDPRDLALDANGNAHVVADGDATGNDIYYLKLASANGSVSSSLVYDNQMGGGNGYDIANSIFVDNTSHPYFFGSSDAYTYTMNDALMVRLNTNSTLDWDLTFDYFVNTQDNVFKMHIFPPVGTWGEQIITCGTVYNNITGQDAVISSYDEWGNPLFEATFDENNGNEMVVGFERYNNYSNFLCTSSSSYSLTITQFYADGTINGSPHHPAFNFNWARQFTIDTLGNSFVSAYGLGSDDYMLGIYTGLSINNTPNNNPASNAYCFGLVSDNLNNVYIAGLHEAGNSATRRIMIQKYDLAGTKIWSSEITGFDSTDFSTQVAKIVYDKVSGAVYVAGTAKGVGVNELFSVIAKLDLNGNVIWIRRYNNGNARSEFVKDLVVSNGNVYITGISHTTINASDNFLYLEKWDINGNYVWDKTYNGPIVNAEECGNGIAVDNAGNVFVTGYCNSDGFYSSDMLTLKYNASGTQLWEREYNGGGSGADQAMGIALSKVNSINPRVYVCGNTMGTQGLYPDIATLKYCDLPATTVTTSGSNSICQNSSTTLVANGTNGGGILWSNSTAGGATTVNTAGNYYFTYSEADGCVENSDTVAITLIAPPAKPAICMVTVDSTSAHNIIYWDKTSYTGLGVIGFKIYREDLTNVYTYIGSVAFASLSEYTDLDPGADPNITTKRYKISAIDSCGNESQLSNYHNTIYIVSNGSGQFSWNQLYTIENGSNPVNNYLLMRDDYNTGNWQQIASTAGTQFNINDINFATFQPTASWRVETSWAISCTPTAKLGGGNSAQTTIIKSKSNITNNRVSGVQSSLGNLRVGVYPNPAQNLLNVNFTTAPKTNIKLRSLVGEEVIASEILNETAAQLDLTKLSAGVYLLEVSNANGKFVQRIVKD